MKIMAAAVLAAFLSQTAFSESGSAGGAEASYGAEADAAGFSMHSRDSAGNGSTLVDDGNGCMIMSTPSGSLSSGC